jgi:hypothetical protein
MIYLMAAYNLKGKHVPYSTISWTASIIITLLLPIVLPIAILKTLYGIITDKDADEALKERSRAMAIYRETSEFEYRSAATVFARIIESISTHETPEGFRVLDSDPIPQEIIVADFFGYEGRLYEIRPETSDEYVKRRTNEEKGRFGLGSEVELEKLFSAQYAVIEKKSNNNLLKSYYLGVNILAKKIAIGNKKVRLPPQSVHKAPQT